MKRPLSFHPPLFAVYPAVALYAANVALVGWQDVVIPILFAAAGGLATWGLIWLFLRDPQRAAAAASALAVGFFTCDVFSMAWGRLFIYEHYRQSTRSPIWVWALLVVAVAVLLGWKSRHAPRITAFLNFVGAALCIFALGTIALTHWGIRSEVARRADKTAMTTGGPAKKPDVIYIVLDGYGRTDTFERLYDFSDSAFIKQLESNGFYVAKNARANYVQTELSMASTLNMFPVQDIVQQSDDMVRVRAVLDERIDDSLVARIFKAKGYRYIAITTGFPALKFNTADVRMEQDSGATLFANSLLAKTPFPPSENAIRSQFVERRSFLSGGFAALRDLARPSSLPRFAVVHILAPHPPFVFGPNGEERRPRGGFGLWDGSHYNETAGTDDDYRLGYRDQAKYISELVLEAISAFPKEGAGAPIILIQGDHGPKAGLDQGSLEKTDVSEAFPILAAYRVPEALRGKLYTGISPVNSFRVVLSHLFGEELPLLPDRSYYSTWERPTALTDVTDKIAVR